MKKAIRKRRNREKTKQRKIKGWRLWLFRFIAAFILPALLIISLELVLRATGYGYNTDAIIKCKVKGQKSYCYNDKFSWLFFPPGIARKFCPFIIPAEKGEDTYRIFVFGASAAHGDPDYAFSFSRILDVMLNEEYPDINFEVINTSMAAINSHVVVEIVEDCAKYEPDLFVLYLGNNEVIGPYGPGTAFTGVSENLSLIRLGTKLRKTRLAQLLSNVLQNEKQTPEIWGGIEMFTEKEISAEDSRLEGVYENFRWNILDIAEAANKERASMIISTVGTNLKDCPPFSSMHRSDITKEEKDKFEEIYAEAIQEEQNGRYEQAVEKYLAAEEIDSKFAELQFRLGRCYVQLKEYEKAKDKYIQARELDTMRLRADSRINEIIKQAALSSASDKIYLADAVKAIGQNSPYGIAGEELFYEHVHLNFKGNYIVAKTLFEQIEKVLPEKFSKLKQSSNEIITEEQCMQRLAFTDWERYMVTRKLLTGYIIHPPFTNQLGHHEHVEILTQKVNLLKDSLNEQSLSQAGEEYRRAIAKRPTDWILHEKYGVFSTEVLRDYQGAIYEFEKVLELVPQYYMAHIKLGEIWGKLGNYDKSLEYFSEALKINPIDAPTHYVVALICHKHLNEKKLKEARKHYEITLKLSPKHYPSYINLGGLLAETGKPEEAIKLCKKGLKYFPESVDLHYNLGCFYKQNGQKEEAIGELKKALELNPEYGPAKNYLKALQRES